MSDPFYGGIAFRTLTNIVTGEVIPNQVAGHRIAQRMSSHDRSPSHSPDCVSTAFISIEVDIYFWLLQIAYIIVKSETPLSHLKSMFKYLRNACMIAALAVSQLSHAAYLVDTGPGTTDPRNPDQNNWGLYEHQWLAERFSLDSTSVISAVTGWVAAYHQGGTAHVSILADDGEAGPGNTLFSSQFNVYAYGVGFAGAEDISLTLPAGSYFVAFQVLEGDTLRGAMPSQSERPLSLGSYGYYSMEPFEHRWYKSVDTNLGIRIEGVSAVPEPSAGALMFCGIAVVGAFAARRRKAS